MGGLSCGSRFAMKPMQTPYLGRVIVTTDSSMSTEPLRSIYADDEAVADILPLFVNNVPKYLENLTAAIREGNWVQAARVCHDLKGTAGGYGYPDIGKVAAELELEIKGAKTLSALERNLAVAKVLCQRAQLALSGTSPESVN